MPHYGFVRASDDVLAVRNGLAAQAIQALHRAGLPAFEEGAVGTDNQPGAVVEVAADAETASAPVFVRWRCDPSMIQAAVDGPASGDTDTSAYRYPGTAGLHMQNVLIKILLSAGIIATLDNDNMNPERVLVFGMMSDLSPALRPTFVPPGN
ncbi:hypothetical protein ACIBCO_32480 [Streptomyces violascens]|uniref:hypothetical protein n=1 Tax=Streptomyces violascens TaxID=67381 RepID=UPI00379E0014